MDRRRARTNAVLSMIALDVPIRINENRSITKQCMCLILVTSGLWGCSVDTGSGGISTVIGSISAGPVAFTHERGKGRAVVWGDEWIEFDSEWQSLPEIEKFWVNMIAWIGPQDSCQVTIPK